jgi:hypothetical protein
MSTDPYTTLCRIREAVLKNTCRPLPKEKELSDIKRLRVSALREGDSQMGVLLFVGIANELKIDIEQISSCEGIEHEEVRFKISKFKTKLAVVGEDRDNRFHYKVQLIRNYLKLVK